MGYLRGTCGLTQLAIEDGEEVVCFFLLANPFATEWFGSHLSSDMPRFYPMSFPVFGTFSEYIELENAVDPSGSVLEHFRHLAESEELLPKEETESLERLIGYVSKTAPEKGNKMKPGLYLVFFHREAYDLMLGDFLGRESRKGPFRRTIFGLADEWVKAREEERAKRDKALADLSPKARSAMNFMADEEHLFGRFFSERGRRTRWLLNQYLETKDEKLLSSMVDFFGFNQAMQISRKTWSPQTAGGEYDERHIHKLLGEFAARYEAKEKAKVLEDTVVDFENPDDVRFFENCTKDRPAWL